MPVITKKCIRAHQKPCHPRAFPCAWPRDMMIFLTLPFCGLLERGKVTPAEFAVRCRTEVNAVGCPGQAVGPHQDAIFSGCGYGHENIVHLPPIWPATGKIGYFPDHQRQRRIDTEIKRQLLKMRSNFSRMPAPIRRICCRSPPGARECRPAYSSASPAGFASRRGHRAPADSPLVDACFPRRRMESNRPFMVWLTNASAKLAPNDMPLRISYPGRRKSGDPG